MFALGGTTEVDGCDGRCCWCRADHCSYTGRCVLYFNSFPFACADILRGVFTDKATWRWCFWINLPLGGITFFAILFLVKLPPNPVAQKSKPTLKGFLEKFDLLGTLILMPWVICLLLALQWGGSKYAWSNWRIILLLTLFSVLLVIWTVIQIREGDKATVPAKIITQRSMASGVWFMFCTFSNFFIIVYYIPIWFQTVRDYSAYQSGINFLTTSAAMSITVIIAGVTVCILPCSFKAR